MLSSPGDRSTTRWRTQFHHERRRLLVEYVVDASSPTAAAAAGWGALAAEHPAPPPRRLGMVALAERAAGRHPSGWILYRIGQVSVTPSVAADSGRRTSAAAPSPAISGSAV